MLFANCYKDEEVKKKKTRKASRENNVLLLSNNRRTGLEFSAVCFKDKSYKCG